MENDQNNCTPGSGPGTILCQARVARGLSREEVAQRLHLAPRQIAALEKDDYANLPGPTYVRGYLRGYANLLGLKPDPVLAAYAAVSESSKKHNLSSLAPKEEVTSQDQQVKFATYVVVAILLGLAVTWWQGRDSEPAKLRTENAAPAAADTELQAGAVTDSANATGEQATAAGASEGVPGAPAPAPVPLNPQTAAAPTSPGGAALHPTPMAPAPAPPMATKPVAPPVAAIPPAVPARSVAQQNAQPASVPMEPSEKRVSLVLYTDEECWVDVRDARKNKLLYENVPAGRRIVLDGAVPFSVYLGNAPGVRLEFNGKPYDISRHKRGLIARFTLGEELVPRAGSAADR